MAKVSGLHKKWMKNADYREAYNELAPEFSLARAVIKARVTAGLMPEQGAFTPQDRIGQLTMRNLDITDSRDKLFVYARAGLIGPQAFEGMRQLDEAEEEEKK